MYYLPSILCAILLLLSFSTTPNVQNRTLYNLISYPLYFVAFLITAPAFYIFRGLHAGMAGDPNTGFWYWFISSVATLGIVLVFDWRKTVAP